MQWSFYILRLISTSTWFQTDMGIKCAKFHFIPMSSDLPPAVMFSPSVDPTNRIRITEKTISHHFIHIDLRMCCCWILPGSIVHQFLKCNFILPSSWQHRQPLIFHLSQGLYFSRLCNMSSPMSLAWNFILHRAYVSALHLWGWLGWKYCTTQ